MPSKTDVFNREQQRIRVCSGGYFHLNGDDVNEVRLEAIASATSRLCRFTGHLIPGIEIYSVAEHSVLVSYILEKMGAPANVVFQGLMHDASEAYLADIAAPFKGAIGNYYDVEEMVMSRIRDRYLLPDEFDYRVKLADWYALFIEARQIVCPDEEELKTWQGYETHGEKSKEFEFGIQCWLPTEAKRQFLIRFAQIQDMMLEV
jgi:5'-deoxynucleotidase YfbR-like HD superfamily hydrolase